MHSTATAVLVVLFLGDVITRPAIGTYALSKDTDRFVNFDTDVQGVGDSNGVADDSWDFTDGKVFTIDLSNGGRFQFEKVGIVVRIGIPMASVGANFQF